MLHLSDVCYVTYMLLTFHFNQNMLYIAFICVTVLVIHLNQYMLHFTFVGYLEDVLTNNNISQNVANQVKILKFNCMVHYLEYNLSK